VNRRLGLVTAAALVALSACAGPPDAARCGERLDVTPTIAPGIDRDDTGIIFGRREAGSVRILGYRFAGGDAVAVPGGYLAAAADAAVSPDGTRLAAADRDAGGVEVITTATGERRSLGVDAIHPAWSPDGTTLAAVTPDGELVLIPADGDDPRSLVPVPDPGPVYSPSWSPAGDRLLVAADSNPGSLGYDELHVVDVASGASRRIVRGVALDSPAWAPDGTRIAFRDFDGVNVACADGGLVVRIAGDALGPIWSPTGAEIALTTLSEEDGGVGLLVVPSVGGGGGFRITDGEDVAVAWIDAPLP
jgi:dipeptidyl aminopeptidase/acylaminoacyl peptidase